MFIDHKCPLAIGDLVVMEDHRIGKVIKNDEKAYGYVTVNILKKDDVPAIEERKISYYRGAVAPHMPVYTLYGSNRRDEQLVGYNGLYYESDLLFWEEGIIIDPRTGAMYNWEEVANNPEFYCDGYAIMERKNLKFCEECGHILDENGYELVYVENENTFTKKRVCGFCFNYDVEINPYSFASYVFDSNISYIKDYCEEHVAKSNNSLYLRTPDYSIYNIWYRNEKHFFSKTNHSDKYRHCSECSCWFVAPENPKHNVDPIVERFLGKLVYDEKRCSDCNKNDVGKEVESYYYKPTPIMFGTGRHYGVELELDDGNVPLGCACVSAIKFEDNNPYYVKHDGSLGEDGMEIVSHPMTIEKHKECIGTLLEITDHFGFYASNRCGLHVHTSRSDWGDDVQDKVYTLLYRFNDSVVEFSQREDEESMDDWASVNHVSFEREGDRLDVVVDGTNDRYHALNTRNDNTYEIRIFASTTDPERYVECIEWVDKLFDYADCHTVEECAEATYKDVFGEDLGFDEEPIETYNLTTKFYTWNFSTGDKLYVRRIDRYQGVFKHYHIAGFENHVKVKLPISGRTVGYDHENEYIGISDANVTEVLEDIPLDVMTTMNQATIVKLIGGNN